MIGVAAIGDSYPFMGQATDPGNNCIESNSGFHISNLSDPYTATWAEKNYWGPRRCCPTSKFYGNVICTACGAELCSAPSLVVVYPDRGEAGDLPTTYGIAPVAPNPFNPFTLVRYQVPTPGAQVSIEVYNVAGQRVATLVDRRVPPGVYSVAWNGRSTRGNRVASGIYFIRMQAGTFVQTRKALLLK